MVSRTSSLRSLALGPPMTNPVVPSPSPIHSCGPTTSRPHHTPMVGGGPQRRHYALDHYCDVNTNCTGRECLGFPGASDAPNGHAPKFVIYCSNSGGQNVTFVNGRATTTMTRHYAPELTLKAMDVESSGIATTVLTIGPSGPNLFDVAATPSSPVPAHQSLSISRKWTNKERCSESRRNAFGVAHNALGGTTPYYPVASGRTSGSLATFSNGVSSSALSPDVTDFDAQSATLMVTGSRVGTLSWTASLPVSAL